MEVTDIQTNIRPKWIVWHRLAGQCTDARTCFDTNLEQLDVLIAKSDPRDNDQANAKQQRSNIDVPRSPWFFQSWSPETSEASLSKIFAAEAAIDVARQVREATGKAYFDLAEQKVSVAEQHITGARSNLSVTSTAANDVAIAEAQKAIADTAGINEALTKGLTTSSLGAERSSALRTRFQAVTDATPIIIRDAGKHKSDINRALIMNMTRDMRLFH